MTRAEELLKYGSFFDQGEVVAAFLEDGGWLTYASIVRRLALAAATQRAKTAKRVECVASQSGPKGNAQTPGPNTGEYL